MPDSRERQVALTFAVKQANVEELERLLLDVSTPGSSLRGEFLSYGAAHNFTANPGASDRVLAWLTSAGATIAYVHRYGHFIRAVASVAQWEAALNTHFVALFNPHAPHLSVHHRAASDVFVPLSLSEDLEGIFDATHPPIKPHLHPSSSTTMGISDEAGSAALADSAAHMLAAATEDEDMLGAAASGEPPTPPPHTTFRFLRERYGIPSDQKGSSQTSQAVFAYFGGVTSEDDLRIFQNLSKININPLAETVNASISVRYRGEVIASVAYAVTDNNCANLSQTLPPILIQNIDFACVEGNLDTQYITAMSPGTPTSFMYVPHSLDVPATDPSSVVKDVGAILDNTSYVVGLWITGLADESSPPDVLSMSYGFNEGDLTPSFMRSFDIEAMKLGLQGVTIIASSGDSGTMARGSGSCSYNAQLPASSPHVLAVGATSGVEHVLGGSSGNPEVAVNYQANGWATGGGFSNAYPRPAWQHEAVQSYFDRLAAAGHSPEPGYDTTGRGYPDVAFPGVNFVTVVGGVLSLVSGTSASTPALAGVVSLINAERVRLGLAGRVGWLNPTLYKAAQSTSLKLYNDVVAGDNQGRISVTEALNATWNKTAVRYCAEGFNATVGWDPTTGFGSVNFPPLLKLLLNLTLPYLNPPSLPPPSPPPPSPHSPPPLLPGVVPVEAVSFTVTLAGDVSTYNTPTFLDNYASKLATDLRVPASNVEVTITAGSVEIVANVVPTTTIVLDTIMNSLKAKTATNVRDLLVGGGVTLKGNTTGSGPTQNEPQGL